jgi:hypothetical protein
MNIYNLHSNIEFSHPDYTSLDNKLSKMGNLTATAEYAFQVTGYLPLYQEKWSTLARAADNASSAMRSESGTAVIHLKKGLTQLNTLRDAYKALEDEEDQQDNLDFRALELSKVEKKYKECLTQFQLQISGLRGATINTDMLASYLPGIEADLQEINDRILAIDTSITTLDGERKTLTDGMTPLEKTGFVDIAKDTLLTAESVKDLNVTTPEVELIKLAIDHMKKVLEGISKNINYQEMYNERERVIERIKSKTADRDAAESNKTNDEQKIKLINSVMSLYGEYIAVTDELEKLYQSVQQFDQLVSNENAGNDDKETRFINAAQPLINYLETVR